VNLEIDKDNITEDGFEYYILATDGVNTARYPVSGWISVEAPTDVPGQKFLTPANPEVVFGTDVEEVVITDVRGNEVFSKSRGGSNFITWNPGEGGSVKLESGLYIYKIELENGDVKYGSLVIAK
jgi:hypothetical protein